MSEKETDYLCQKEYERVFNRKYHTESNKELFGKSIPDGWDIFEYNNGTILFVIENKRDNTPFAFKMAKTQLINYIKRIPEKFTVYLVIGQGTTNNFVYHILDKSGKITEYKFEDFIEKQRNINTKLIDKEIHEINQIIYNELPLQKQQKTLFISAILICLKIDSEIFKNYSNKIIADKILEIIDNHYQDKTFTNNFKFISKNIELSNRNSIQIISNKLSRIMQYDGDILNKFYSEFCKWDKNDDKQYGIVLTPEDIVKLMIQQLEITTTDKVLDFCCGTGSFIIECGKYTSHLYACEHSDERYTLAKCNFILNNLSFEHLIYNSCFNMQYHSNKFDKIIINPPFALNCPDEKNTNNNTGWTDFIKEQKFAIYAIELLKPNGLAAIIIPSINFSENKNDVNRAKFKKTILKYCNIIKIITCNQKVFYPVANVKCSIIILQKLEIDRKITKEFSIQTTIIDYTDDGYSTTKNKRIKTSEPNIKEQIQIITPYNNWNYEKEIKVLSIKELNREIKIYNITYNSILSIKNIIQNNNDNNDYMNMLTIERIRPILSEQIEFKTIYIKDILKLQKPIKIYYISCTNSGNIPLISSRKDNNGITKYISEYSYDCSDEYITVNKNGSVGYCFVQIGKIAITIDIIICKLIDKTINIHLLAILLTIKFTQKYSYNNKLNMTTLFEETIQYPLLN